MWHQEMFNPYCGETKKVVLIPVREGRGGLWEEGRRDCGCVGGVWVGDDFVRESAPLFTVTQLLQMHWGIHNCWDYDNWASLT